MKLELYTKDYNSLTTVEKVIRTSRLAREEHDLQDALEVLSVFAEEALDNHFGDLSDIDNLVPHILKRVAEIDTILGDYANQILHHPSFQKIESAWRGLYNFMIKAEPSESMQIMVLPVTKKELLKDMQGSVEFDQSALFKKVYEEEYGTFGGNPFSMLIGDFYFDKSPKDIAILEGISSVAAAAHTPFLAGASPLLFGMDDFKELYVPVDMKLMMSSGAFSRWNTFRGREDSKYITLALPHVLQREVYGRGYLETELFPFEEEVTGFDNNQYLWGNAAYVLGNCITKAFNDYRWCAAIRGVEGGGIVEGLPTHEYITPTGEKMLKGPTDVLITDRREKELSDLGFMPLCIKKNTASAVFFGVSTVASTKTYKEPEANANAKVAVQLHYLLIVSRFAHYFKVMLRDKVGKYATISEIQSYLEDWVKRYVINMKGLDQYSRSIYPLREARVEVFEIPSDPGMFKAVCFLRPHFQLEEITVSLRIVAVLPPPAKK